MTRIVGRMAAACLLVLLASCGKGDGATNSKRPGPVATSATKAPPASPGGTVRIAFGDCAGEATRFVSGPRPAPFDIDTVNKRSEHVVASIAERRKLLATLRAPTARGAAPKPDEGKMGTRESTRDEGKMGKRDSTRPDPRVVRQRVAEQARIAGLSGTMKPGSGDFASLTGTGDMSSGLDDRDVYGGILGDEPGQRPADSGRGEFTGAPGSGGSRTGPIPGSGRGGMPRRPPSISPRAEVSALQATDGLDTGTIGRYLRLMRRYTTYCYEKQLLVSMGLAGDVAAQFTIGANGVVTAASAKGVHQNVSSCIARILRRVRFPKPKGDTPVTVNVTFKLFAEAKPPPAPPEPQTAPTSYEAGKDNPLRAHDAALQGCFRTSKRPYGVGFVTMSLGTDGTVSKAEVVGFDDPAVATCVASTARKARFVAAKRTAYRCPMAFGTMPTDATTTVDITGDSVTLEGKVLAGVPAIIADTSPQWKIHDLHQAARYLEQRRRLSIGFAPIAIDGPGVVRPLATTPMKVVYRVLLSLRAADGDWALAHKTPDGWQVLLPAQLPVAPVPILTGGSWPGTPPRGIRDSAHAGEPRAQVSVLVAKDELWIGLSGGQEIVQIKNTDGKHDWAAFDQALTGFKKSPRFSGRVDIELAADDDVAYAQFVQLIERVTNAGMSEWRILQPPALSARFRP